MVETHTYGGPLLTIKDVNLTLGGRKILRDVDATILDVVRPGCKQGQVQALLGPSGIGKTQLFKLIAGFNAPDTGTIRIGKDQTPTCKGKVGVVSQNYTLWRNRTVLGNLVYAGERAGLSSKEALEKATQMLSDFGLIEHKDKWPYGEISGGQRQRLAILRQIMIGHEIICMDEPFSGLDVTQEEKICKRITDLVSDNEYLTILVVTHDIPAAISIADHVWLLGKEKDELGNWKEGARVVAQVDLITEDLAWHPDIRHDTNFLKMVSITTERFRTLQ